MLNLFSNALKFTQKGGSVKIICNYIQNEGQNGSIKIQIKDSGVGIKKEDIGKLFKMFGFLQSKNDLNPKGIGLGLHIS